MVEAGLEDTDRVLDIGCGSGRIAAALANVLTTGRYEGFDVDKSRIAWAKEHIELPQFNFRHVDVKNGMYSRGLLRKKAVDFAFPYPDDSFDFAIATSLFTHLLADEASHYLAEVARVLDGTGTLFATFFIVDEFAVSEVRAGNTRWLRQELRDGVWVQDPKKPELAIGFPPERLDRMMLDAGLTIDAIRYGSWCGRSEPVDYQDIVIASARAR